MDCIPISQYIPYLRTCTHQLKVIRINKSTVPLCYWLCSFIEIGYFAASATLFWGIYGCGEIHRSLSVYNWWTIPQNRVFCLWSGGIVYENSGNKFTGKLCNSSKAKFTDIAQRHWFLNDGTIFQRKKDWIVSESVYLHSPKTKTWTKCHTEN